MLFFYSCGIPWITRAPSPNSGAPLAAPLWATARSRVGFEIQSSDGECATRRESRRSKEDFGIPQFAICDSAPVLSDIQPHVRMCVLGRWKAAGNWAHYAEGHCNYPAKCRNWLRGRSSVLSKMRRPHSVRRSFNVKTPNFFPCI